MALPLIWRLDQSKSIIVGNLKTDNKESRKEEREKLREGEGKRGREEDRDSVLYLYPSKASSLVTYFFQLDSTY